MKTENVECGINCIFLFADEGGRAVIVFFVRDCGPFLLPLGVIL